MPIDKRRPSQVWDAFTLDLIIRVAEMSILHPVFAMWVPLLTLAQGHSSSSLPYRVSFAYLLLTLVVNLVPWSSGVWTNRSWRGGVTGLFSGPSIVRDEQVVLVTGGASGVGEMIVETLGVMGVTVVVLDLVERETQWDDVYYFKCDLADPKAIGATLAAVREEVGEPTILINNAGVVQGKLLTELTLEEVKQTFDVNVLAQFTFIRELLPAMLKKGSGHIVTVSSVLALNGVAQLSDYCASKQALIGLHESLRYELKYRHADVPIRTTLLLPGHIRTPLFASIAPTSRLANFVFPVQNPHDVAKKVISALETEQSREIYVPRIGGWVGLVKGMPSWVVDWVISVSGANDVMRSFAKSRSAGENHE